VRITYTAPCLFFNFDVEDNVVNKTSRELFILYKMDGKVFNCESSFIT
jgi:hypothetical protein